MNRTACFVIALSLSVIAIGIPQTKPRAVFNHPLQFSAAQSRTFSGATPFVTTPETLRILCAMVDFQEDNDGRTTGNGTFDLSDSLQHIVDPPPHNKAYFENHLRFASNYFRRVSDGKRIVVSEVLTDVYRLPQKMQQYSPPRTSTDNTPLANLAKDAWHIIDSSTPGIPYQDYDAFILFHAGIGRDVASDVQELDPTPFDIPSIYLNLESFRSVFGSSYQGIPVAGGTMHITNSMILPETESRKVSSITGSFLLELGINGLLVASIGSHLGLPDLFDTKTGKTGIGRFGLMDGQSIFSWNGVFPPEPSAWEKYYLGWIDPITITSGDATYPLPAVGMSNSTDTVYKVLISAHEYFLVENRNRDANNDGAIITTVFNGVETQKVWYRDTANFNAFDLDSIYGVVVDVDEFDWSLPGGVNSRTNEWFNGGALVWHIDEDVINAGIPTNAVNADAEHRGVDLEEADGSQDIGQSYEFLTPGSGSEDGTALDFWYQGNSAPVRSRNNRFTPLTFPNSKSYAGANSHIYIKNFSARAPRMTVDIQVGDSLIQAMSGFPKYVGTVDGSSSIHTSATNTSSPIVAVSTEAGIFAWNLHTNTPAFTGGSADGIVAGRTADCQTGYPGTLVLTELTNDGYPEIIQSENRCDLPMSVHGSLVSTWSLKDTNTDGKADKLNEYEWEGTASVTSPVRSDSLLVLGLSNGSVGFRNNDGTMTTVNVTADTSNRILGMSVWQQPDRFIVTLSDGDILLVAPSGVIRRKNLGVEFSAQAATGVISANLGKYIVAAGTEGDVYMIDENLSVVRGFPVMTGGEIMNAPALCDIDGDKQNDIVVFSGNKIWAINASGAVLDNFPITVATQNTILTSPVIGDLNFDGSVEIIAITQEGLIVAYTKSGKMLNGFPLSSGNNNGSTPALFSEFTNPFVGVSRGLVCVSSDGYMYAWRTSSMVDAAPLLQSSWHEYMHNGNNIGYLSYPMTAVPRSGEFMPARLAYNWPNPVGARDNYKTHIRYFLSEDATVEIKILDLAGDLVTTINTNGTGGLDNEVLWDVAGIESGIYFAHIEAKGSTTSGSAIIKIAVVK